MQSYLIHLTKTLVLPAKKAPVGKKPHVMAGVPGANGVNVRVGRSLGTDPVKPKNVKAMTNSQNHAMTECHLHRVLVSIL